MDDTSTPSVSLYTPREEDLKPIREYHELCIKREEIIKHQKKMLNDSRLMGIDIKTDADFKQKLENLNNEINRLSVHISGAHADYYRAVQAIKSPWNN